MSLSSEIFSEARSMCPLSNANCYSKVVSAKSCASKKKEILADLQFVGKFNSSAFEYVNAMYVEDGLPLGQNIKVSELGTKNDELFHNEQTTLIDDIIVNESPVKDSIVNVGSTAKIEPCEESSIDNVFIENIYGNYSDYFSNEESQHHIKSNKVSSIDNFVIENIYSNYSDYFCDGESQHHIQSNKVTSSCDSKIVPCEELIIESKDSECLEDVPEDTRTGSAILGEATNLKLFIKTETSTADTEKESRSRNREEDSSGLEKSLVDIANKKIKISIETNDSAPKNCSGLHGNVPNACNNFPANSNSIKNNSTSLLPSTEENEKIMSCVKSWNKKYHWMTYAASEFRCTLCPESAPIYILEKASQIFYVSGYLLEHESVKSHQLALNALNNQLIYLIVELIRSSALSFNSKESLYQTIINQIEISFKIKATEKQIDDLILRVNLKIHQLQMDKITKAASGEMTVIIDECRNILFIKSINSEGHPEEYFVTRYLVDQTSFDRLLRTFFHQFVYYKVIFCGGCRICLAKGKSFTHTTLPPRYPKLSDLVTGLEKDAAIRKYCAFIELLPTKFPLIFDKKYHWTDKTAFDLLKSKIPEKYQQVIFMEEVFQIFDNLGQIIFNKKMSPLHSLNIDNFLDKLKGILSDTSVHYIKLFGSELSKRYYYYGLKNILDFEFLFSPLSLQSLLNNQQHHKSFSRIFYLFRSKFPGTTPENMMAYLAEFGNYYCQISTSELTLFSILQYFKDNVPFRESFSLVFKFYKMIALLPFFSAGREYSLFRVSALYFTLNNLFGKDFASKISSIFMVDLSVILQCYEEINAH